MIGAKTGSLAVAAQLVGRHLGKHIPGNPTVINRQMPGGAHLNATNHIFNVAEADGLTILAANPNVAMGQLAKLPNVRFDVTKFIWLGSSGPDGSMFSIRASLPFKTFQEMRDSGKEFVAGTTGPGSNAHDMPLLLKEFAGLNITAGRGLCRQQRHPAGGRTQGSRMPIRRWPPPSSSRSTAAPCARWCAAARRCRAGTICPTDESLATNDTGRALMAIRGIPQSIGRAFAVRPGTPADRVAMLREGIRQDLEGSGVPRRGREGENRHGVHLARAA